MKVPEPRKLSSGVWFIQLRLGGQSIPVTAATKKDCINAAALIKAEHKNGKLTVRSDKKQEPTLYEAIDKYIEDRSNTLSPATIRGYRTMQRNRFKSVSSKKLSSITNWQKIVDSEAEICSPKTLANAWGFVVSILNANKIAVPSITLPQIVNKERPWLDTDELQVFLKAIEGDPCEIGALLALHSLRRSEIYGLTWDNIDLKKGIIKVSGAVVPNEHNKVIKKASNKNTSSQRYVPIMIPRLKELLEASDKTKPIMSIALGTLCNRINRVCAKAGLPEVGTHGLRHSFASLAYHLKISEKECMALGGWSDSGTMHKIYTHISARDISEGAKEMAKFFQKC